MRQMTLNLPYVRLIFPSCYLLVLLYQNHSIIITVAIDVSLADGGGFFGGGGRAGLGWQHLGKGGVKVRGKRGQCQRGIPKNVCKSGYTKVEIG